MVALFSYATFCGPICFVLCFLFLMTISRTSLNVPVGLMKVEQKRINFIVIIN